MASVASLLKPVRHLWPQFTTAILCGIIYGAATGAAIPLLIKEIIPVVFEGHDLSLQLLISFCLLPTVVMAVRAVGGYYNTYLMAYCGQMALEVTRQRIFDSVQQLPLSYFRKQAPGELISRAMQDTQLLRNVITQTAQDVVKQPMTLLFAIGYLIFLTVTESRVGYLLLFIASVPLCVAPIRYVGRKVRTKARKMLEKQAQMTQQISQNVSAIVEVRAFCLEARESERFRKAGREFSNRYLKLVHFNNLLSPAIEVIAALGIGIALFYTYWHRIDEGVFVSLIIALYLCYEPVKKLGRLNAQWNEGQAALTRIESLLHEPPAINDPEQPVTLPKVTGNVCFENVCFAYTDTPVLTDINRDVAAGKVVALVGASGAGKSTFCNLIPRFYDVDSGRITLDGIDIRQLRQRDLRQQIAIVPQQPVLFNESIEDNLRVGQPDATHEAIEAAARKAYAHEFITKLDDGYQTFCGERGDRLSGGQKQRIAIARAFLKAAPILILDEATSALDAESEAYIQRALAELMRGKTVFIIAHRFSSIRSADEILVFDQGRIVETGTHDSLFASAGVYRRLYENQLL